MALVPTFDKLVKTATKLIGKGCFLNSAANGKVNSMAMGWGTVGNVWRRPMFTVMVGKKHYTHELMEANPFFTISISHNKNMTKEILLFGRTSGRDVNKFEKSGLILKPARKVNVPIIKGVGIQFECKVLYKSDVDFSTLDKKIFDEYYKKNGDQTIYYGEILDSYID